MNILVIDDNQVDRVNIVRTLKRSHLPISYIKETDSETIGFALLSNTEFDVLILGYRIPKKSGLDFMTEMHSSYTSFDITIIIMSTSDESEIAFNCLNAGAHDFIVKAELSPYRIERAILLAQMRYRLETHISNRYLKVKELAENDPLTQLANRHSFDQYLDLCICNNKHLNKKIGLILLDIDDFKIVNDTHGHDIGDLLLIEFSNRIASVLRNNEQFSRLGGDEFAIILPNIKKSKDIISITSRILHEIKVPILIKHLKIKIGVSIGVAIYPENTDNKKSLIKKADIALYLSKSKGKNQFCFFKQSMQNEIEKQYKMEEDLYKALKYNELYLVYQPAINLITKALVGFEALIRWKSFEKTISPSVFIPIAEKSNLIVQIGRFVFEQAIKQLEQWNSITATTALKMAINISPLQLREPDFVKHLISTVEKHKVLASQVELEITETALFTHSQQNMESIVNCLNAGFRISLDDFGTGYSSLSHLQKYPIDTVKIDKSLIENILICNKDFLLVKGLVRMLKSLNLHIVVEGIESKDQEELCEKLNINCAQGYYFSKPLRVLDIDKQHLITNADHYFTQY